MTQILLPSDDVGFGPIPDCPYRGLHAYTEADGEYFFGRDSDRDLVTANLVASRLTVLYGPSGVGKSSLLQAGVMRKLRQLPEGAFSYLAVRNAIVVYHSSWHGDSLMALGSALLSAIPAQDRIQDIIEKQPALSAELLAEVIERLNAHVYLLLDQFEEQTLYQTGPRAEAFLEELGAIITSPGLRASVLIGVREDALANLDRLGDYLPGPLDNNIRLGHLNRAAAREAIQGPLTRYNAVVPATQHVNIESELIDELLPQLQTGSLSVGDAGQGGVNTSVESIETPYLQLVMTRLWAEERKRGSQLIRRETLTSLGGAGEIVRTHLDAVMSDLTEQQRETAAEIFRYLVTPSGMKIAYTAEDLAEYAEATDPERVREVLERLAASRERVLRPVPPPAGSAEAPRYEIFHDVMADAVLDWRRRYVAKRQRIAREEALVLAKQEAEEKQRTTRKRLRRSRILSAALALLLVTTIVGFASAQSSSKKAASSRNSAQQQAMMAQYREKLQSDPAGSLQSALHAWRMGQTSDAELAVRTALDADTQRLMLKADSGNLASSEFSPDGLTLLTAGDDGIAKLFNAITGQPIRSFIPTGTERPSLQNAAMSRDGTMVLTATTSGIVHLYDLAGRDLGILIQQRGATATWGTVDGNQVVLTFGGGAPATLWDAQLRTPIARYGPSSTYEAALSPDGRHVLTLEYVEYQASINVWDAKSGRSEQKSEAMSNAASPQFASAESDKVLFYEYDGSAGVWRVALWDWVKGSEVRRLDGWSREYARIVVSSDRQLVAAPLDKYAKIFNADTGEVIGNTTEQADWVNDVAFSADGLRIVTGGNDGKATVWNAQGFSNRPIAELLGHNGRISDVQFDSHDSWRITTASADGTARTWQLAPHTVFPGSSLWMLDADMSGNGQTVVTAEEAGDLRIYQLPAGGPFKQWKLAAQTYVPGEGGVFSAKLTPDAQTVVSARWWDFAPWVWPWYSGGKPRQLEAGDEFISRLAISPDGTTVAAGDDRNRLIIWNLSNGRIIEELGPEADNYQVTDVTYIPHSTMIATASTEGTIRLFDPAVSEYSLRTLGTFGDSPIRVLDVSPDGTYLASVSDDRKVRIWRISDGKLEQTIDGPQSTHADVAFSPDGTLVALAAADAAVHVWAWREDRKLAVLRRHGDLVNSVQFSPDGDSILTTSDDGTAAIFLCTTCQPFDELLAIADQQARNRG
jgi:WD40 repeat protein